MGVGVGVASGCADGSLTSVNSCSSAGGGEVVGGAEWYCRAVGGICYEPGSGC